MKRKDDMVKNLKKALSVFLVCAASFSCAVEVEESAESIQNRRLQAYLDQHYPGIQPTDPGFYILDQQEGDGPALVDTAFVFLKYNTLDLNGNYLSTTYEDIAKNIGTYSPKKFYGDYIWQIGAKLYNPGLEEMIKLTKVGGRTKALIPAMKYDKFGNVEFNKEGEVKIYDVAVNKIVKDIDKYQIDQLEEFADRNYNGLDSTKKGFYFKKIQNSPNPKDTIMEGGTIGLRYVGKLLDGKVFDTNIADTARKYGVYNRFATYDPLEFTFHKNFKEAKENNTTVDGFTMIAIRLQYDEKGIGFFWSDLGYGDRGNVSNDVGVPGYYPMFFEVWIEKL